MGAASRSAGRMIDGVGFSEAGRGAPALIFIHGGLGDRHDWSSQFQALSADHHVLALDLPGHGQSHGLPCRSIEELAAAVQAVRRECVTSTAFLVGHGFGCSVAVETARQDPCAIAGLILIEGHPLAPAALATLSSATLTPQTLRAGLMRSYETMFTRATDPSLRRRVLAHVANVADELIAALVCCGVAWGSSAVAALGELTVPTLLIEATSLRDGRFAPLADGEEATWVQVCRDQLPGVQVTRIRGAGHLLPSEQPAQVNDLISDFVVRLSITER